LKKVILGSDGKEGQQLLWSNMAKYLQDCYSALPHPSRLQWPFASCSSLFDVDLYDAPLSEKEFESYGSLPPLDLKSILNRSYYLGGASRKVILIEGVAGSGKSTLCWYACREWASGSLFDDIKLLIYASLSDNSSYSVCDGTC
jgi:hypothetical protein